MIVLKAIVLCVAIVCAGCVNEVAPVDVPVDDEPQVIPDNQVNDDPSSDPISDETLDPEQPDPIADPGSEDDSDVPVIAIIIDDMGYGTNGAQQFLVMDIPLTFAFLSWAPHTEEQIELAVENGHEVMVHVPMQARSRPGPDGKDYEPYPGPGTITVDMDEDQIAKLMRHHMEKVPFAVGVNNHMGSKATADEDVMRVVLTEVLSNDLFFVDSMTTSLSVGRQLAQQLGVKFASNDVFLDNIIDADHVRDQVLLLGELALIRGSAVGIGHPHIETANGIALAVDELRDMGVELVLASSLVEVPRGE